MCLNKLISGIRTGLLLIR